MAFIYSLADTWADGATTFKGISLNVTDTASAAGSLLMDLQVGGSSALKVNKLGNIAFGTGNSLISHTYVATALLLQSDIEPVYILPTRSANTVPKFSFAHISNAGRTPGFNISSDHSLNWNTGTDVSTSTADLRLHRDTANTLAQRNGGNPQAFNLYNTYTDASNYERGFMRWSSNFLTIGTEGLGAGAAVPRGLELSTGHSGPLTQTGSNIWDFCNSTRTFPSIRMATGTGVLLGSNLQFGFSSATFFTSGSVDTGLKRSAATVIAVTNGSTGGGSLEMQEVTAPAAPATNNVRIYAEDNGAGKTRLMALFPTGVAQQIAIEP